MGLIIHLCALVFFAYILTWTVQSGQIEAVLITISAATAWFLFFIFFFLKKVIYIISDKKERTIQFGNVLFRQECTPEQIHEVKKVFWSSQIYKISIGEMGYYFVSSDTNLASVQNALKMTS